MEHYHAPDCDGKGPQARVNIDLEASARQVQLVHLVTRYTGNNMKLDLQG